MALKRKSEVWLHFTEEKERKVKCLMCGQQLSVSNKSTCSLIRHLNKKHPTQRITRQISPVRVEPDEDNNYGIETYEDVEFADAKAVDEEEIVENEREERTQNSEDRSYMKTNFSFNGDYDECGITARYYAYKLRKMDPLQRLYADRIINDVLLEGQLGTLSRNTTIAQENKSY